jgi:hypothetical protein
MAHLLSRALGERVTGLSRFAYGCEMSDRALSPLAEGGSFFECPRTIAADGSLVDRRVWAQLAPTPALEQMLPQIAVGPDGCTLDEQGHIWTADEAGGRCIRVAPGGTIVDEIHTPEGLGCFACALGGDDVAGPRCARRGRARGALPDTSGSARGA